MTSHIRRSAPFFRPALFFAVVLVEFSQAEEKEAAPTVQDTMLLHDLAQANRNTAATEVLAGSVAFSEPEGSKALVLDRSFGATLDAGGMPRVETLLPAPDLRDPATLQTRDAVEFRAQPLEGAVRYRAVIATDAGFIDNIAEQFSDDGAFALADLPNGNLFVRVSAVAPSGLEGGGPDQAGRALGLGLCAVGVVSHLRCFALAVVLLELLAADDRLVG